MGKLTQQLCSDCPECPGRNNFKIGDRVGTEAWWICDTHLTCWPDLDESLFPLMSSEERYSFVYDLKKVAAERRKFFKKYRVVTPRVTDLTTRWVVEEAQRVVSGERR